MGANERVPDESLLALVRPYTGEVYRATPTKRGYSADVTALLESAEGGFFIKCVSEERKREAETVAREAAINPWLGGIAPPLVWQGNGGGHAVALFEAAKGRSADLTPGSVDVERFVGLLERVGEVDVPRVAEGWVEEKWDWFARDWDEVALLRGGTLVHSDINPSNFIIGSGREWLVDWSWPTVGAPFIDAAILVAQAISAGVAPAQAEGWVSELPGWKGADPKAVDVFAAASLRMELRQQMRHPDEAWIGAMVEARRAWCEYRGMPEADIEYAKAQTPWVWE